MADQIAQQQERRIIFGNFSIAVLADCKVYEKKDIIVFSFRPTYSMKVRDQIKDSDFEETTGLIVKAYPEHYVNAKTHPPRYKLGFYIVIITGRK